MLENVRPRIFFEVGLGSDLTGRIVVELFNDLSPKLVESFGKLCGDTTRRDEPFYCGSSVTRIVRDEFIQVKPQVFFSLGRRVVCNLLAFLDFCPRKEREF